MTIKWDLINLYSHLRHIQLWRTKVNCMINSPSQNGLSNASIRAALVVSRRPQNKFDWEHKWCGKNTRSYAENSWFMQVSWWIKCIRFLAHFYRLLQHKSRSRGGPDRQHRVRWPAWIHLGDVWRRTWQIPRRSEDHLSIREKLETLSATARHEFQSATEFRCLRVRSEICCFVSREKHEKFEKWNHYHVKFQSVSEFLLLNISKANQQNSSDVEWL